MWLLPRGDTDAEQCSSRLQKGGNQLDISGARDSEILSIGILYRQRWLLYSGSSGTFKPKPKPKQHTPYVVYVVTSSSQDSVSVINKTQEYDVNEHVLLHEVGCSYWRPYVLSL